MYSLVCESQELIVEVVYLIVLSYLVASTLTYMNIHRYIYM